MDDLSGALVVCSVVSYHHKIDGVTKPFRLKLSPFERCSNLLYDCNSYNNKTGAVVPLFIGYSYHFLSPCACVYSYLDIKAQVTTILVM